MQQLLAAVPGYAAADLGAQMRLAVGQLAGLRAASQADRVTPWPSFAGAADVGGADGDLIVGDLMLEIKSRAGRRCAGKTFISFPATCCSTTPTTTASARSVGTSPGARWRWPGRQRNDPRGGPSARKHGRLLSAAGMEARSGGRYCDYSSSAQDRNRSTTALPPRFHAVSPAASANVRILIGASPLSLPASIPDEPF